MQIVTHANENQELVGQFDFSIVPEDKRARAIELDRKMGESIDKLYYTTDEIGEIGREMKAILPHGYFMRWYQSRNLTSDQMQYSMYGKRKREQGKMENMEFPYFGQPQIKGPDEQEKERVSRPDILDLFDDDADDAGYENGNGSHEPPLERVVPGTVTSPEKYKPETIQRGDGQLREIKPGSSREQTREAKQEYNKQQPWEKAEAMARAKPMVEDAPTMQATRIRKPDIGDRKDYIGDEFLIDYIGDLMQQARNKGYIQELKDMLYTRGFLQPRAAV